MATVTHGVTVADTANVTSYATGSFTPAASDLLILFGFKKTSVNEGTVSDSLGGTWTFVDSAASLESVDLAFCFVRDALVPGGSMTVAYDCTGDAAAGCILFVARVSGMSNTGASAIRQSAKQENQIGGAPAPVSVFASACITGNPTLGMIGNDTNPATMTAPTGWTEQADTGFATPAAGGQYVSRDSGFTGTTITWGSDSADSFADIIIELDAPAAGGSGSSASMPRDEVAMDTAQITFCIERIISGSGYLDLEGRANVQQLPWCFVRFNAPGEERRYVMPLPPQSLIMGSGVRDALADLYGPVNGGTPMHYKYGRGFIEWMPNKPFPLVNMTGPRSSGDAAGAVAIHFFGGI